MSGKAFMPANQALAAAGLQPLELGPKEGLALLNGTQFSTACALAGLFEAESLFQTALITGALSTDAARGSDTPFDPRIHQPAAAFLPDRNRSCVAAPDGRIRHSRLASGRRSQSSGSLLPALPATGHGRGAQHLAPMRNDFVRRSERRFRQSLDLSGKRRSAFGGQFPRRACRLRGGHHGDGTMRDRIAGGTPHSHAH